MKKMLFVYNPHAGKARIRGQVTDILNQFIAAEYRVEIYVTQCVGDATEAVKRFGPEFDRVVCSGGDGTLNEVISGLMQIPEEERPVLGYIPAGTTNDFSTSLRLPGNMAEAAAVAAQKEPISVDVGSVNDGYFTYTFGFGAFTDVSYETPQEMKRVLGHPAYLLEGLRSLSELKPTHLTVTWEGEKIEDDFLLGLVTNSESVAGMTGVWGDDVLLDDGMFEMTLIRMPKNLLEWANLPTAFLTKLTFSDLLVRAKTTEVRFHAEQDVKWVKDGEFGGLFRDAQVKVVPRAISIVGNIPEEESA